MLIIQDSSGNLWQITAGTVGQPLIATSLGPGTAPATFLNDSGLTTSWRLDVDATSHNLERTPVTFSAGYPTRIPLNGGLNLAITAAGNLYIIEFLLTGRDVTTAFAAAMVAGVVRPALFVEATFNSGAIHVWSGMGTVSWNGHTWTGVGALGAISPVSETGELRANSVTLSLSMIPSDLLALVLTEIRQGLPCTIWIALLEEDGTIVEDPYVAVAGRIDAASIDEGVTDSRVTITVENQLVDFQRARQRRYTDQDQQQLFPGDRGFEYVPKVQSWDGVWGRR